MGHLRTIRGQIQAGSVHLNRSLADIPSAICPWTPQHGGLQRDKVTHDGTEKKRPG
jgi:hypothetical protein